MECTDNNVRDNSRTGTQWQRAVDSLILLTHLSVNLLHPVRTVLLIKTSDRAGVGEWEYQSSERLTGHSVTVPPPPIPILPQNTAHYGSCISLITKYT